MDIAAERCPRCGLRNYLIAGYLMCDEDSAWRNITCENCGMTWNEVYRFSHNEDVVTCTKLEF